MCDLKNAQNKAFGVESYQIHIFFRPKLKLQHFIKQMIDLVPDSIPSRYPSHIHFGQQGRVSPPEILFHTLSSQPSFLQKERYLNDTAPCSHKNEETRIEPLQLPPTLRMTANALGNILPRFLALQRLSSGSILQKRRHKLYKIPFVLPASRDDTSSKYLKYRKKFQ